MASRRVMPPLIDGFTELEEGRLGDPMAELVGMRAGIPRGGTTSNKLVRNIVEQLEALAELDPHLADRCKGAIDALTESASEGGGGSVSTSGRLFGGDLRTPV